MVEAVFQLTHLMTVNARWDGLDHTVKVSGRSAILYTHRLLK